MRFLVNVLYGLIVYCRKPKKPSSGIGTLPFLPAIPKTPPVLIFSQKEFFVSRVLFLGISSDVERFLFVISSPERNTLFAFFARRFNFQGDI